MNRCKLIERFVSSLMILCISLSLIPNVSAAYLTDLTAKNWEDGQGTKSPEEYWAEIVADCNRINQSLAPSLEDSTKFSADVALKLYVQYITRLDWLTRNIYYASNTEQYTLVDLPNADGIGTLLDRNEVINLFVTVCSYQEKLKSISELYETETDLVQKKLATRPDLLMIDMPEDYIKNLIQTPGALIESYQFKSAIIGILQQYVDAKILAIVASDAAEIAKTGGYPATGTTPVSGTSLEDPLSSTNYNDLKTRVDNAFHFDNISNQDAANSVYTKHSSELKPLLTLYGSLINDVEIWNGRHLMEYKYKVAGVERTLKSKFLSTTTYALEPNVSSTLKAFYRIINPIGGVDAFSNATTTAGSSDATTFDASNGALALMSTATLSNDQIVYQGDPALKNIGWVILAAGMTYDPFVSVAGNDLFLETIQAFLKNDNQVSDLNRVLQTALNSKKPLYVTEVDKNGWKDSTSLNSISLADYRPAYLQDVLQIDQSVTRAYCVIRGLMTPSAVDGSTWEYSNKGILNGAAPITSATSSTISTATDNGIETAANTTDATATSSDSGSGNSTAGAAITVGSDKVSASSQQVTTPLMITSGNRERWFINDEAKGYPAAVGGLTSVILHNAASDAKNNKYLKSPDKHMLFINGLGDIVLADNTVILPAIANPVLYEYGDDYTGLNDDDFREKFLNSPDDAKGYYPYTAAFMNHYPSARINNLNHLEVTDSDINKYLFYIHDSTLAAKRLDDTGKNKDTRVARTGSVRCAQFFGDTFCIKESTEETLSILYIGQGSGGVNWTDILMTTEVIGKGVINNIAKTLGFGKIFSGGISGITEGTEGSNALDKQFMLFITKGNAFDNISGNSFFPLIAPESDVKDSYLQIARPMVTSALRYVSVNDNLTNERSSTGRFLVEHYITDYLGEGMLGTQYAATLEKNFQVSYEDIVADTGNRFLSFLVQITENAINYLGKIDGVLAIKGPYENTFFNVLVSFVQRFYLLIAICLLIIVAVKFLKGHFNFIYVCFIGLVCVAGFEVYSTWLPNLIPSAYNFVVNDAIEDIVWNTVEYKAEIYDETYKSKTNYDPATGRIKSHTSSITLYTLTNQELATISTHVGVDDEYIRRGAQVFLDENAGIYLQGNQIRMSVDRLFVNNSMRGLYKSQWDVLGDDITADIDLPEVISSLNGNPYSIQLTKPYVSLEFYYTPFCHIERSFMKNLNNFSSVFRIQRNAFSYDSGKFYKDAFITQSFIGSGIFTVPGSNEILYNNIAPESIKGEMGPTAEDILAKCHDLFYPEEDWLNLRSIFAVPDRSMKLSLWGQVLKARGLYDDNWAITEEGDRRLSDLIYYINDQTKQWVIDNHDNLTYMSDENVIKVISLYATTAFTHYASEWGDWLYPNYINASDIALQDVLYGSMTTIKDRNFAYDGTVTNTVAVNLGIFGVLFLLFIVIFSTIFIFVVTYLIAILYGLFGIIIVFKLINNENGMGLVKGYVKVTVVTIVLYICYSLSLQMVELGGYNWYGYLGCALVEGLIVYFLFWTVLSVVQNVGELGNDTLGANLIRGLGNLVPRALKNLAARTINVNSHTNYNVQSGIGAYYRRGYNVDDYDYIRGSRSAFRRRNDYGPMGAGSYYSSRGYGRYDDVSNETGPMRRFIMRRMLGRSSVANEGSQYVSESMLTGNKDSTNTSAS